MALLRLGKLLMERRGGRGVREIAKEIGVSPATLSRVEGGKLPDLLTFQKICAWLKLDPAEILDIPLERSQVSGNDPVFDQISAIHFKADAALSQEAANDLSYLILTARRELARRINKT
jgi:transcriptional regulator with XRE-family HTH domain